MTFAVTQVTEFNPAAPTSPTRSVQFQLGDENVGGRNVDTVNIRALGEEILRVRVAVGEQVNVLTIESEEAEE